MKLKKLQKINSTLGICYYLLMIFLVLIIIFVGLSATGILENIRKAILWG